MKKKKPSPWEEEGLDGYDWYEGQPKWPLRRIIGTAVILISVFIYGFLFFRFFTAFSGGFGEQILLSGKSRGVYPSETAVVRRFYPETRADDDGSVQLIYTVALETTDSFQCTVKINKKAHSPGGGGTGYRIALRWDLDGETRYLPLTTYKKKDFFEYRHLVCQFDDVPEASRATLTLLICPDDAGEAKFDTAFYSATVGGTSVYSVEIHPKDDQFVKNED